MQLQSEFVKEIYLLDKLPFEEQRVIHALVVFWKCTRFLHLNQVRPSPRILELIYKCSIGIDFFRQVYHDLCSDRRIKYVGFSETEFKQFLEIEYNQPFVEHQAQARANQEQARADFDALGKEMAKATSRAELVKLGRKRADLAQYIGVSSGDYESHCWRSCPSRISSAVHARCPACGWYICNNCSSCSPDCNWNGTLNPVQDKTVNPFLDMPDDFIL